MESDTCPLPDEMLFEIAKKDIDVWRKIKGIRPDLFHNTDRLYESLFTVKVKFDCGTATMLKGEFHSVGDEPFLITTEGCQYWYKQDSGEPLRWIQNGIMYTDDSALWKSRRKTYNNMIPKMNGKTVAYRQLKRV